MIFNFCHQLIIHTDWVCMFITLAIRFHHTEPWRTNYLLSAAPFRKSARNMRCCLRTLCTQREKWFAQKIASPVFLHACVLLRTSDLPWQRHPCFQRPYDTMATPKCTSENRQLCVSCAVGNLMKQWLGCKQIIFNSFHFICFVIYEILHSNEYFSCWLNRVLPVKEHRT